MKIHLFNLWLFTEPGSFVSLDLLPVEIRTRRISWYDSFFALDITQMYCTVSLFWLFHFNIYNR